jgi:hypothetical protein
MASNDPRPPRLFGAYGLALPDLVGAVGMLAPAPADWPAWRVQYSPVDLLADVSPSGDLIAEEKAQLRIAGGGWADIDRNLALTTLHLEKRPDDAALLHPLLSSTAVMAARWRGWHAFHAGGLVIAGGVWGVLGEKGAGKSSTLAWLATARGAEVLSDDVLIVDEHGRALTGPRCIDLRPDVGRWLGRGESIGAIGGRERWRLGLETTVIEAPLHGWIQLAWGDEPGLEPLAPGDSFEAISSSLALRMLPPDVAGLIELAGLPAWRLVRPRRFEGLADAVDPLLEVLSSRPVAP